MTTRRPYRLVAAYFLLSVFAVEFASAQKRGHFVLDPGHGGNDPGSQRDNIKEKELTLDLAKRMKKVLNGRGHSVTLTRDSDVYVTLEDRGKVANQIPGSIINIASIAVAVS